VRHDDGTVLALGAAGAAGFIGLTLAQAIRRRAGSRNLPREEWAAETFTGPLRMHPQRGVIVLSTWMAGGDPAYQHAIDIVQGFYNPDGDPDEFSQSEYDAAHKFMESNAIPVEDAYKAWRHAVPNDHHTQNPAWIWALDLHPDLREEAIVERIRTAAAWALQENARQLELTCDEPKTDLVDNTYVVCPLTSDQKLHHIINRLPIEGEGELVEDNDGRCFQWNNHWYFPTFISVHPNGLTEPGIDLARVKSRVTLGGRPALVALPDLANP